MINFSQVAYLIRIYGIYSYIILRFRLSYLLNTEKFYFQGFHSFDNSCSHDILWKKREAGDQKFKGIIQDKSMTQKDTVDGLLEMLNDKTQ